MYIRVPTSRALLVTLAILLYARFTYLVSVSSSLGTLTVPLLTEETCSIVTS